MDGVMAIAARMGELRARFEPTTVVAAASTPTSTTSSTDFESVLAGLLGSTSTSSLGDTSSLGSLSSLSGLLSSAGLGGTSGLSSTNGYASLLQLIGKGSTTGTSIIASVSAMLGSDGIPDDLAAYGNGKIPSSALGTIGSTGHRLWAPAAAAMEQLISAAAKDGVKIGITDSYRTYDSQVELAQRKGLYTQGGLAAVPGTSDHGWGLSTDLDLDAAGQSWMRAHAAEYGFGENTPREPWHWTFGKS